MRPTLREIAILLICTALCTGGTFTCKSGDDDDDKQIIVEQNSSEQVRP
jgi:hypothetical protein